MKTKRNRRSPVAAFCSLLGTILLIFIILICIPLTMPKVLGYEIYSVISGSMEPAIPVGSLVLADHSLPQDVESGDVIVFYGGADSRTVITHRVVENYMDLEEFITKGDANTDIDVAPVPYNNFIGEVIFSIPYVGVMAQFLTGGSGKIAAAGFVLAAILLQVLANVIDKE